MPGIMVCGTLGCICTRQTGLGPHSRLVRSFAPPTRQGSAVLGRGCRRGSSVSSRGDVPRDGRCRWASDGRVSRPIAHVVVVARSSAGVLI